MSLPGCARSSCAKTPARGAPCGVSGVTPFDRLGFGRPTPQLLGAGWAAVAGPPSPPGPPTGPLGVNNPTNKKPNKPPPPENGNNNPTHPANVGCTPPVFPQPPPP